MLKTQKLARCGLLLALLCLSSQLKIPLPGVPISLQWTMVVLIAFLLSWKEAMLTVSLYVVLGLMGLPVFTGGGGLGYLLSPTFGYLLGFIPASGLCGLLYHRLPRHTLLRDLFCGLCGMVVLYGLALPYLACLFSWVLQAPRSLSTLLSVYFLTFVPSDLAGIALASILAHRLPTSFFQ